MGRWGEGEKGDGEIGATGATTTECLNPTCCMSVGSAEDEFIHSLAHRDPGCVKPVSP